MKNTCYSIKVNAADNVAVVVFRGGLNKGSQIEGNIQLLEDIPQGHKVALCDIAKGEKVIRYGQIIGYTIHSIQKGAWVKEELLEMPESPCLDNLPEYSNEKISYKPLDGFSFQGYKNTDGSVGTKNILCITTSVQCVSGVTDHIVNRIRNELLRNYPNVDDVVGITHSYGCGVAINAPAAIIPIRTLRNIPLNPNFGGEVMVLGLGCEKLQPQTIIDPETLLQETKPSSLSLQEERFNGFEEMVEGILETAKTHLEKLNLRKRETCPASELVVGVQCGGSDALSGLTANPAVGFATDLIVRAGGSVMFSEVTEVRDGVNLLSPRISDPEVSKALIREMSWYDDYLNKGSVDRSANTTPGNKKGGLSNIVEKAMGSIIKSGSTEIVDVIGPGERIRKKGLTFCATPASDFICGTLQLAAGMNIHVFTTGRGTPYGLKEVPVIKVSTNSALSDRWHDLIDVDAGKIAAGQSSIEDIGWEIFNLILDVASGRKTVAADRLGLHNDLVLFNPAPIT